MKKRPKVAVVLSGGGALGFAHIGVFQALKKHKIPVDMIVGTSMGAIVGGAIACGRKPDDLVNAATQLKTRHLYDFNINLKGLLSGKSVMKFLRREIPEIDQKDTKIQFFCNAVDLISGKEVVFKDGNILENIRASMSVPGVFNPVKKGDMLLVDGGLVNNMGHDIARREGADIIIAVDVNAKSILPNKITNALGCLIQSFLIFQKQHEKCKRKYYNVLIQPELGERKIYKFDGEITKDIIELGRIATEEKINKIKEIISDFTK